MSLHHHHDESPSSTVTRRAGILTNHLLLRGQYCHEAQSSRLILSSNACFGLSSVGLAETEVFDTKEMRKLLDCHNIAERDWLFGLMEKAEVFNPVERGGKVYVMPDYNQPMEKQREMTLKRIRWLLENGVYRGWCTESGPQADLRNLAMQEVLRSYDLGLGIEMSFHFFLWGSSIRYLGTKEHHDRWLRDTEAYAVSGCFAMTELGHGSNVRGIETVATYDSSTREFIIHTPCETAQKYFIGGAAKYATHAIVFAQLTMNGTNQGVHGFIVQIRDADGNPCPNIRLADCGHKTGMNGVDNGRIWFDNVRVPRENFLNAVADVTPDGQYLSKIKNPVQRFALFVSPLTLGRVIIATAAIYSSQIGLAIAIRYGLTRRAFSVNPNGPEVLLLDYPSHQRRLLPLIAKTYAMTFAGNWLKLLFAKREPALFKTVHVFSSAYKAIFSWHNMRTLQECREACGGQGLMTANRIGQLKTEFDAQSTFEGDNNIMMKRVSEALLAEFAATKKHNRPFQNFGLEHMNESSPVIPSQLTSTTLRSIRFQINAFRLRERDLLNRFAAEVNAYQAKGESKEEAINLAHELVLDLSRAFSDRAVLESTIAQETSTTSGPMKNILSLVRSMYALICIEEDDAFLRYGYLSPQNTAGVRKEVAKLCSELRPHALTLVSSFGIPDSFLGPIAFDWVKTNSWCSVKL